MAWTTPITWTFGQTVTAAQLNSQIRDNFNETSVAKTTTAGSYSVGTAANAIAERTIGHTFVATSETTVSTTFDDLATLGPAVTVTTSTRAICMTSCQASNNTVSAASAMGVDVSGATTAAAANVAAFRVTSAVAASFVNGSYCSLYSLNAGSNVFTAKYAVTSGTGTFVNRRLTILPF